MRDGAGCEAGVGVTTTVCTGGLLSFASFAAVTGFLAVVLRGNNRGLGLRRSRHDHLLARRRHAQNIGRKVAIAGGGRLLRRRQERHAHHIGVERVGETLGMTLWVMLRASVGLPFIA